MGLTGALSGNALRQAFIQFFTDKKAHQHLPSASLVPENPTVLLTPAGMLPFVPIFLGIAPPPNPPRAVTVQKCARVSGKASDLSYVGRTSRHHTFFEMLGNFSFGDYFKREIIPWSWEFVTTVLGLPAERLWVSVYKEDMEARDLWRDLVGVPEHRILFGDEKDNFWGPPGPTGPCGPCSEIYYDRGPAFGDDLSLESDRLMEIWNLVFMEFFQDEAGNRTPLEKKNVDTGMGLERLAMVIQNTDNTFETDLFFPIVQDLAKRAGVHYKQHPDTDVALKVVADHLRFAAFALADGIVPSNEGRGYILRMIMRRAIRTGKRGLGLNAPFLHTLVATVRDLYAPAYPEVAAQYQHIVTLIQQEETRFFETLERGSRLLDDVLNTVKASGHRVVPGEDAFKLYDTYGFPLELTVDAAEEAGLSVDEAGFQAAMAAQKTQARQGRKAGVIVKDQVYARILEDVGATRFLGYESLSAEATVKALIVDGQPVDVVAGTNTVFECVLDQTPFYAESGGQAGDSGSFSREHGPHGLTVVVNDTVKVGDLFVHRCLFDNGGQLRVGETLLAQVEPTARQQAARHHTATHLLQAALRKVLGDGVTQAGSQVSAEGARFDFTFPRALKPQEVARVEFLINQWIRENVPRELREMPFEAAKAAGALVMAGEQYAETVRVIGYGEVSKELCGGTHVERLGEIGLVKIVSESAIAAGIRRIELVAAEKAYKQFKMIESELLDTAAKLKIPPAEVPDRVEKLLQTLKDKDKQIQQLEERQAAGVIRDLLAGPLASQPVLVQSFEREGWSTDRLRWVGEQLAQRLPSHILVLAAPEAEKVAFVAFVSADFVAKGVKAGDLVKLAAEKCAGGGGGKPQFAQAGGKNPAATPDALKAVQAHLAPFVSSPVA
jgi:alanyl-tRNA synthetase